MKKQLEEMMLETIFVKTGGRPENPEIAKICAEIALSQMKALGLILDVGISSETKKEPVKIVARIVAVKDLWGSRIGATWEGELLDAGEWREGNYLIDDKRGGRTLLPKDGCELYIKNEQGEFIKQ